MEIYLILVMLILPGPNPPVWVLERASTRANSFSDCQIKAEALADKHRQLNAALIQQQGSKVSARCYTAETPSEKS